MLLKYIYCNFFSNGCKILFLLTVFPSIYAKYWNKHYITYSVENNTFHRHAVDEAVREWNVSSLEFKQVDSGNGDIKIYFFPSNSSNITLLGQAYYPPKGIIYINEKLEGNNLKIVLIHEFGHALGLKHNFKNNASIMFHYFIPDQQILEKDKLSLNEIYRCRYDSVTLLNYYTYLKFKGTSYERVDFSTGITTKDKIWYPSIKRVDAMYRNNSYFIISKKNYYKFDHFMNFIEKGNIQSIFPNIQSELEAVLTLRNGSIIVFINNNEIWSNGRVYRNMWFRNNYQFPTRRIQGAYQTLNRNIVLISHDEMWIYNEHFKFIAKKLICNEKSTLKKIHCCNKYSNA